VFQARTSGVRVATNIAHRHQKIVETFAMAAHGTLIATGRAGMSAQRSDGAFAAIAVFWREFLRAAFNPYHPEQHYMRGPGPAWRAKHGTNVNP
jgi:hypothetical protein